MSIRICVIGNSGSGKSTLSKALGAKLGIPVFHLDRELLHGNFEKHPLDKRIELHAALTSKRDWVIDGNYDKLLPARIEAASLAVFLDTSRFIALPRVLRRARRGGQPADTVPSGAKRETTSWVFIKWVAGYSRRKRAAYVKELCEQYGARYLLLPNMSTEKQVAAVLEKINGG